jgi:hypothetical protein
VAGRLDLADLQAGNDLLQALPPPIHVQQGLGLAEDPVVFDGSGHGLTISPGHRLGQFTISRASKLPWGRYTFRAGPCSTFVSMERPGHRLNVTLDPEHAARLARLAERTHVQEGTLARSLLSVAIEEADPEARNIVAVLDGIPGAYEHALQSLERARAGETISLDEL